LETTLAVHAPLQNVTNKPAAMAVMSSDRTGNSLKTTQPVTSQETDVQERQQVHAVVEISNQTTKAARTKKHHQITKMEKSQCSTIDCPHGVSQG